VALKVVNQELLKHPQALARFEQEARSAAKLPPHQNIVQTFTFEQLGNLHLLVLEYVDGVDLEKFVHTKGVPAIHLACHLVRQAALGLQHAHEHKLIHRDIKPNNLMLTRKGQVKLLDFGLSKVVQAGEGERQGLTGQDAYMGTPDYMAPEQAMSARDADIRADLYSLGCTLYFLLTGRPPFPRETRVATYMAHQTEAPPPPSRFRPEVPPALDAIVLKLLAKLPQERFQKPVELAQALAPFAKKDASVYQAAGPVLQTAAPPTDKASTAVGQDTSPNPVAAPPQPAWSAVVRKRTSQPMFRQGLIVAAAAVVMLAALGIVLYIATDHGTITIELSDPTAQVELKVDGDVITLTGPTDPLRLKPGPHGLTITGKDLETTTHEFTVHRGEQAALKINLTPKGGGKPKVTVAASDSGSAPRPPDRARPKPTTTAEVAAHFQKGSVWKGSMTYRSRGELKKHNAPRGVKVYVELQVTERTDTEFRGICRMGSEIFTRFGVSGKVTPNHAIDWTFKTVLEKGRLGGDGKFIVNQGRVAGVFCSSGISADYTEPNYDVVADMDLQPEGIDPEAIADAVQTMADRFQEGSTWIGTFTHINRGNQNVPPGEPTTLKVTVTFRRGEEFRGELRRERDGEYVVFQLEGKVGANQVVTWTMPRVIDRSARGWDGKLMVENAFVRCSFSDNGLRGILTMQKVDFVGRIELAPAVPGQAAPPATAKP
jgi:hypothetical protein